MIGIPNGVSDIVDAYSHECLSLEVDTSLSNERVVRVLERLREWRRLPQVTQVDNGPAFTKRKKQQPTEFLTS